MAGATGHEHIVSFFPPPLSRRIDFDFETWHDDDQSGFGKFCERLLESGRRSESHKADEILEALSVSGIHPQFGI
jgi:hypothetical protein